MYRARCSDRDAPRLGASHEAHKTPTSPAGLTTEAPHTKRDYPAHDGTVAIMAIRPTDQPLCR
jgi:hypothetical protein